MKELMRTAVAALIVAAAGSWAIERASSQTPIAVVPLPAQGAATEGWAQLNRAPDLGWAHLAGGGLSVRAVPGNHRTMAYGPNARRLARQVTECLTQA